MMRPVIQYLHNRSDEWETWLALLVLAVVATWCMFHWRVELHHIAEAGFAAILAAVPRRAPEMIACLIRRLRSRQPVALPPPTPIALSLKEPSMSFADVFMAEVQAEEERIFTAARAVADAFLEAHFSTSISTLSAGAQAFAADAKSAHDAGTKQAWAQFVAKYAEEIDAAAKAQEAAAQPIGGPNQEQSA